jgi:hypothetical protein
MDGRPGVGLDEMIEGLDFDIAIIHLGTNDIGHRKSSEEIGRNVRHHRTPPVSSPLLPRFPQVVTHSRPQILGIIEALRVRSPRCAILVSKLIPISHRWGAGDAVERLNEVLPPSRFYRAAIAPPSRRQSPTPFEPCVAAGYPRG